MVAPLSERRVFWLVGDRAGCHAVRCSRRAENMRENRAASTFMQVTAVSPGVCKTVGLAYVGSNPTPATTCGNGPWPGVFRACGLLFPARSRCVHRNPAVSGCARTYSGQRPGPAGGAGSGLAVPMPAAAGPRRVSGAGCGRSLMVAVPGRAGVRGAAGGRAGSFRTARASGKSPWAARTLAGAHRRRPGQVRCRPAAAGREVPAPPAPIAAGRRTADWPAADRGCASRAGMGGRNVKEGSQLGYSRRVLR